MRILIIVFTLLHFTSGMMSAESLDQQPKADSWKAGTAKINITPESPLWMAGFAARTHPATLVASVTEPQASAFTDAGFTTAQVAASTPFNLVIEARA